MAAHRGEEGGYDCQLVGEVDKNVHCTFCLQIFRDPYVLKCCQNHFCRSCVDKLRREGVKTCPICRQSHSPQLQATPSRTMKEFVDTLWVFCRHRDNGCPWNGELRFFKQHLQPSLPIPNAGCPFHEVSCTYRCGKRMPRWQIQQHQMDQCHKRPLLLRLSELEQTLTTKLKVGDGSGAPDSQKKREGDIQRQLSTVKKQIREEMESYKENVAADCLRLREKLNAQEAKLRDLKPKSEQFREIHRQIDQLRGELHSMKQQLSSLSARPEPPPPLPPPPPPPPPKVKAVPPPTAICTCPKLKEEVTVIVDEVREQIQQLRVEFNVLKAKIATSALHERKPRPTPAANFKHELEQIRRYVELELERSRQESERNRQEMMQERSFLYRERLELEQKMASCQPRPLPERLLNNATLPPVVVFQKDMWGSYEFQDLWALLRKSQKRYIMVEVGMAVVLLGLFLAFLLHANHTEKANGVLKECTALRNSFIRLRGRVKKLEGHSPSIESLQNSISRLKLTMLGLRTAYNLMSDKIDDMWPMLEYRVQDGVKKFEDADRFLPHSVNKIFTGWGFTNSRDDGICEKPADSDAFVSSETQSQFLQTQSQSSPVDEDSEISSTNTGSESNSDSQHESITADYLDNTKPSSLSPSPTVSDIASSYSKNRMAILASPALALFPSSPAVVPPIISSDNQNMAPLIQRVWEVMRLLPPVEFVLNKIGEYVETGSVWQTERFYSGRFGYSLSLQATVDQIGVNNDQDTYLSLYVHLRRGNYDDQLKWPFTGHMVLQIVNWAGDHDHLEWHFRFDKHNPACARVTKGEVAEEGTGLENFVSLAELKRERDGIHYWDRNEDAIKLRVKDVIYS